MQYYQVHLCKILEIVFYSIISKLVKLTLKDIINKYYFIKSAISNLKFSIYLLYFLNWRMR